MTTPTLTDAQFVDGLIDALVTGGASIPNIAAAKAAAEAVVAEWRVGFLSNAQIGQTVTAFVTAKGTWDNQLADWWAGTVTGGPNGDGYYPYTDKLGVTSLQPCPAKVLDGLSDNAIGAVLTEATAARDAAQSAQSAAEDAQTGAGTAATDASTAKADALSAASAAAGAAMAAALSAGAQVSIFLDDGYSAGLFDGSGHPVLAVDASGNLAGSNEPALRSAADASNSAGLASAFSMISNVSLPIFIDDGYGGGLFDVAGHPILAVDLSGNLMGSNEPALRAAAVAGLNSSLASVQAQVMAVSLPIFLDDGYGFGSFDANGFPILAASLAGVIVGASATATAAIVPELIFLDDGVQFAVLDATGATVYAKQAAELSTVGDTMIPVLDTDGSLRLLNGSALNIKVAPALGAILNAPRITQGGTLQWVDKQGATYEVRSFSLAPWAKGAYSKLVMVPNFGQSLSVGVNGGQLYTTTAIAPGRAKMFNGGPRTLQGTTWGVSDGGNLRGLVDGQLQTLVDLAEFARADGTGNYGETHQSGQAYWLINRAALESTSALLFSCLGIGGAAISLLSQGTPPYANLIRSIQRGKAIADYLGIGFEVPAVVYDQGEADYGGTPATFQTALLALQAALTTDINAITGVSGQVPLLCAQPSSWTAPTFSTNGNYSTGVAGAALKIVDAAIANPTKIFVVGPQYWSAQYYTDGVHMQSRGYRQLGEYDGRALAAVRAGGASGGLYATAAAISTGSLTLTMTFTKSLVLDTSLVSDPGQRGLRLVNGSGTSIALSSIAVSGNTLTATLASAPTGSGWIVGVGDIGTPGNLAGPTTGPRTNLRDASTDVSADGLHLYNWACHQQIAPTIGA